MPAASEPASASLETSHPLVGEQVLFAGTLAGVNRREAVRLVEEYGGTVVTEADASVTIVVVGEETADWRKLVDTSGLPAAAQFDVVAENLFWQRLGLVESVQAGRLYTPVMLAELVNAPVAAIRRWYRRGYLKASREMGRLPYLEMSEVHTARTLARLLEEGCSLSRIDKLVVELTEANPELQRPLAELSVISREGRLYLRRGDDLAEPGGQLVFDFEQPVKESQPNATEDTQHDESPAAIDFTAFRAQQRSETDSSTGLEEIEEVLTPDEARLVALDCQAAGDLSGAIEACRAALLAGGDAEDQFLLADLLYQSGDLAAARERYYVALEMDDRYVEARVNLGCVLAELHEMPMAVAALRGALSQQEEFADAHYHLARTLDDLEQPEKAAQHWARFLELAPASPWAEEAAERLNN